VDTKQIVRHQGLNKINGLSISLLLLFKNKIREEEEEEYLPCFGTTCIVFGSR
jgi:hypothetical protein